MTICNGGIRLVELEILMVMLGQKDNGKSKSCGASRRNSLLGFYVLSKTCFAIDKNDAGRVADFGLYGDDYIKM
jgi:hypothetical protein